MKSEEQVQEMIEELTKILNKTEDNIIVRTISKKETANIAAIIRGLKWVLKDPHNLNNTNEVEDVHV